MVFGLLLTIQTIFHLAKTHSLDIFSNLVTSPINLYLSSMYVNYVVHREATLTSTATGNIRNHMYQIVWRRPRFITEVGLVKRVEQY